MSILNNTQSNRKFINVLASDGTFRMTVPEGTEGSEERKWETKDGKSGVKHELKWQTAKGKITNMEFRDGEYGEQLILTLESEDEQEDPVAISLQVSSPFGEDVMKKLPNINLKEEVLLRPFNFDDDNGKNRRGMAIKQGDNKIENYYYDVENKKPANGYPAPQGDETTSDDWKVYFINARKFLVKETKERIEKLESDGVIKKRAIPDQPVVDYPTNEDEGIDPDEIPF